MYYDKFSGLCVKGHKSFSNKGMLAIVILAGVALALISTLLYTNIDVELSATALRSCAGCVGQ